MVVYVELDSAQLAREKQASRDRDAARLDAGSISLQDLKVENTFFSALPLARFRIAAVGNQPVHHPER